MAKPFESTQKQPVTCPVCGQRGLARYRGPETYNTDTRAQEWAYWPGERRADGLYWPDLSSERHPCERPKGSSFGRPDGTAPAPGADLLGQAIATAVEPYLRNAAVDTEQLEALIESRIAEIREELAEALKATERPLTVTVKRPEPLPEIKVGLAHKQLQTVLWMISHNDSSGFPLAINLWGKPGASKSHTATQLARILEVPFYALSVCRLDQKSSVFGFKDVATGTFHTTGFVDAWTDGGLILMDEWDNANGTLQVAMNLALSSDKASFPHGMIPRHPKCYVVAAMNTAGRGGDQMHPDRQAIDSASIDRFTYLEWEYDGPLELALARRVNPNAGAWVQWVQTVRAHCETNRAKLVVSPRASITAESLLTDIPEWVSFEQLADMTLFKGIDKGIRARILAACPLPVRQ